MPIKSVEYMRAVRIILLVVRTYFVHDNTSDNGVGVGGCRCALCGGGGFTTASTDRGVELSATIGVLSGVSIWAQIRRFKASCL
jgi:hypothetical protein